MKLKFEIGDKVVCKNNLAMFILRLDEYPLNIHAITTVIADLNGIRYGANSIDNIFEDHLVSLKDLPKYLQDTYNVRKILDEEMYIKFMDAIQNSDRDPSWEKIRELYYVDQDQ